MVGVEILPSLIGHFYTAWMNASACERACQVIQPLGDSFLLRSADTKHVFSHHMQREKKARFPE